MINEGITWHALTLSEEKFEATINILKKAFNLSPAMQQGGFALFQMQNGTMLELYTPASVPPYGYNGSVAIGFRVDDIEAASEAVKQAGGELLGEIVRMEQIGYAYRHYRGVDGLVYGLNEQKQK